jgi:hypothetical protein
MATLEPPMDAKTALATQRMAIGLAADVERLNALDDIWTAYLGAEHDPVTLERDLPELGALVDEMCSLLDRVGRGSHELRTVISRLPTSLDDELRQTLKQLSLGQISFDMLPEPPFAAQVAEACSIVEEEAPAAIHELTEKLRQLRENGYAPGDLGRRLKCAILLAGAGASLVGLVIAPVAPIPGVVVGAAGLLVSTLASANGWSCKRAGDLATARA